MPQITLWMSEEERYCDWWNWSYPVKILLGLVTLGAGASMLDGLIRRYGSPWLKRAFDHLFLVALVSGMLAAFPAFAEDHPQLVNVLWIVALLGIAGSFLWRRSRLVHGAAVLCLIFSPLIPILFVQMLTWPRWSESLGPVPTIRPADRAGTPVFIFVFDEWSWLHSTRDGQFLPMFPNVRALCEQSVVFRRTVSPHRETMQSLPRFIFQTGQTLVVGNGQTMFQDGPSETPSRESPSLFAAAREHGYRSWLLGWFHPYSHLLGDQVDVCRSYFPGNDKGPVDAVAGVLLENSRHWTDPVSRRFGPPLLKRIEAEDWYRMGLQYRRDMLDVLAQCPAGNVVLCHVPSPHAPYVFNPDGSYHGVDAGMSDTDGYLRQLAYMDTLVGQIVATLRASGKFDDALLLLTSDHGWRFDPGPAFRQDSDWDRHVPLIVKLPRQTAEHFIDEPFCTNRIEPLLEAVFRGESRPQQLLDVIHAAVRQRESTPISGDRHEQRP